MTNGRFSGTNNGCFVGHISPEAAENGPIAAVCDGDLITIDIPNGTLTLHVDEAEIQKWIAKAVKPVRQIDPGYLNIYAKIAESADKGAIIWNRSCKAWPKQFCKDDAVHSVLIICILYRIWAIRFFVANMLPQGRYQSIKENRVYPLTCRYYKRFLREFQG